MDNPFSERLEMAEDNLKHALKNYEDACLAVNSLEDSMTDNLITLIEYSTKYIRVQDIRRNKSECGCNEKCLTCLNHSADCYECEDFSNFERACGCPYIMKSKRFKDLKMCDHLLSGACTYKE